MTDRLTYLVIAPPPTPNGDLHVGHLSGPYLGADVFSRFQKLHGHTVIGAVSTDENQSYVVTTAERLGADPFELAKTSHQEVRATLQQADLHFDMVGRPDSDYAPFIVDFFARLHSSGALIEKDAQVYYDPRKQRYLFESYIGGRCPICFEDTRGNICEGCGHPNDPFSLIQAYAVGKGEKPELEIRTVRSLFLSLETYRDRIEQYYAEHAEHLRPTLRVLIKSLLAAPLPDFPITYVSDWGVRVPLPGYESAVYNVWAEMYPGHLYWLRAGARQIGVEPEQVTADGTRYVQFLGFDNSFFYTIAHLALAMAAQDAGIPAVLPSHFITNEFYLLENYKFSTSQGHLIWAKDLLAEYNVDAVRFYLCLSNPETQQANFVLNDMVELLEKTLIQPFDQLQRNFNQLVEQKQLGGGLSSSWSRWLRSFQDRFEIAYNPDTFSLRLAATTLASYIHFLVDETQRALDGTSTAEEQTGLGAAFASLAIFAAPIMPNLAARLAECLNLSGELAWSQLPLETAGPFSVLPSGILGLKRD